MAAKNSPSVSWPRISIVIPTLNEARNLPHVFKALPSDIHEIVVVDGYSVDDTLAVVRQLKPDARIVMQTRRGKGNALACGCMAATGDIIALIDADGSNDATEIPAFVSALLAGADFAKGTRFAKGGGSADITRLRRLGNRMLTGIVNVLYGVKYTDLCYGFNVFWRRHLTVVGLDASTVRPTGDRRQYWGDGFEIETLINIRNAAANLAVVEVPSFEHARIHGASNLSAVSDGLRVLRTIIYERFAAPRWRRRSPAAASSLPTVSPKSLAVPVIHRRPALLSVLSDSPEYRIDGSNIGDPRRIDGNPHPGRASDDSKQDERIQSARETQTLDEPQAVQPALNRQGHN
jgi:glycosyltransferase involved in cell wall biosynthesis